MSKTPLKTDPTLVQGARDAAMAGVSLDGQDGMAQGMDKLMEISQDAVKNIAADRKAKREEGDELAEKVLENGGGLGSSWLDAVTGEVETLHGQYDKAAKWGRKNKRDKNMQELNGLSSEVATIKELNNEIATAQEGGDWCGDQNGKEQTVFNAFLKNDSKKRIVKGEDGVRRYEVYIDEENGWMSTTDISRMADEHKKDYATMVDVRKQAIDIKATAEADAKKFKEANGNYVPENMSKEHKLKQVAKMNNTLSKGNIKSLMHDDVLENGTPWVKAVASNPEIINMTYESLGIDPSLANRPDQAGNEDMLGKGSIDIDGDGKISEQEMTLLNEADRNMITAALTDTENEFYDEERTRGMMASYYVDFINQNYDAEYKRGGGGTQSDAKGQYVKEDGTVDLGAEADDFLKEINITGTNE